MEILKSDKHVIVCIKEPGVLSTDEPGGLPSLVRATLGDSAAEVRTVHRLDRVVGGVTVLAGSKAAASLLGKQIMEGVFQKTYLAVVHGELPAPQGSFEDLLCRDVSTRRTFPVDTPQKGASKAFLDYSLLECRENLSLVRISLKTGRTHQIRVQFASRGFPIVGDRKYGEPEDECGIALWSAQLSFIHPGSGKRLSMSSAPPRVWPWTVFSSELLETSLQQSRTALYQSTSNLSRTIPEWTHKPCPHDKKCGGCQYQQIPYSRQLELKESKVRRLLADYCKMEPIVGMDSPFHYRGKVQAAFGLDRRGKIISGVYQSSSHRIVPVSDCMIEDETADRIIAEIRRMLPVLRIPVYDERRGTGWLRHVLVKRSFTTGQIMVVLVTVSPVFPAKRFFVKTLLATFPEIVTVVLNINHSFTSLVLGEREIVLYGDGYIEDELCGCRFRVSSKSFYQVNPVQTEILYRTAIGFAGLTGTERVLDAYCGTGTIGIASSSEAGQVTGVELNRDAVRDAIANARRNNRKNCWFTCADAGEFMEASARAGEHCDVVFMDPPRAGSDSRFLSALIRLSPSRIVYVSCNPESLARDLQVLIKGGYRAVRARCIDMFPFTEHVETVVSLSLEKPDRKYMYIDYMPDHHTVEQG